MALLTLLEHSSGQYSPRTWHNAQAGALTVAFAIDFNTAGEKLTAKASAGKYVAVPIGTDPLIAAEEVLRHWQPLAGQTLNVAGNGIYTLAKQGWRQSRIATYVLAVLGEVHRKAPIGHVVSGGQTGVDLAAAVVGRMLGIDVTMTFPKGFLQRHEDGRDKIHTREEIEAQVEELVRLRVWDPNPVWRFSDGFVDDALYYADGQKRFDAAVAVGDPELAYEIAGDYNLMYQRELSGFTLDEFMQDYEAAHREHAERSKRIQPKEACSVLEP